jgi:beta-mannosidase
MIHLFARNPAMTRQHQSLPTDWTLQLHHAPADVAVPDAARRALEAGVPATVPGCVHTDLIAAGLIPDPYLDRNEPLTHWIGWCDWASETTLQLTDDWIEHDRTELVFDGLDTVAEVWLNGVLVGRADNMHVRHRFDIRAHAKVGENKLRIVFASPRRYAEAMNDRVGDRPRVGAGSNEHLPHQMMRKMACNFGWDWGPQLLTCGIWRPARLEAWSNARLGDVRPLVSAATEDRADIDLRVEVEATGDSPSAKLVVTLRDPAGNVAIQTTAGVNTPITAVPLRVDRPRLWWPVGHGEQPLYDLHVQLVTAAGELLAERRHRIGLRTTELCRDEDAEPVPGLGRGTTFHLKVNGKRIFCRGANWIPDDCFPHRVTPQRYRQRVDQALEANMNMLRVWGGGIFEDAAFYEYCDHKGMLVWQDFLLACACYPEEEPFWSWFEAEARDNVSRLSRHPSLVLWNGCNENIWGTFDWAEEWVRIRTEGKRSWGLRFYLELFPQVMAAVDPSRPYWPGSPYSGSMDIHPNANEHGNRHIWDVWNGHGDYRNYLGHFPRFASEFGYQGPCNWPTITRAIPEDQRQWLSEAMHLHNKQKQGQQRALDRLSTDFDLSPDDSLEDLWFLASINQCRALQLGCEWFRALSPWCSGALYWQLNDCWPVTSWAAIDGDGRPKLLWHATRRFFRPRMMAILPAKVTPQGQTPATMAVRFHNDTDEQWRGRVAVSRLHVDRDGAERRAFDYDIAPRETGHIVLPGEWTGTAGDVLLAEAPGDGGGDRAWWFFGADRDIPYRRPNLRTKVESTEDGHRVTVTTDALVRDLCLLVDRLEPDATASPQRLNLLPGEAATFHVRGLENPTPEVLQAPHVLRCVNELARTGRATLTHGSKDVAG